MTDTLSSDPFADLFDSDPLPRRDRHGISPDWHALGRPSRNALSRLLGGGTLRSVAPETVRDLRRLGLIEGDERAAQLTGAGWELLRGSRAWLKTGT